MTIQNLHFQKRPEPPPPVSVEKDIGYGLLIVLASLGGLVLVGWSFEITWRFLQWLLQ